MGLAEGCRLLRNVNTDQVITCDDVAVPEGRLSDKLRAEQNTHFAIEALGNTRIPPATVP
jgi:predicted homoserine dehydrogenase-like protein